MISHTHSLPQHFIRRKEESMANSKIVNDIVYHFGRIGNENPDTGWRKEFNLVSWNGEPPKFEVRA